jgi:hypothetical protein
MKVEENDVVEERRLRDTGKVSGSKEGKVTSSPKGSSGA